MAFNPNYVSPGPGVLNPNGASRNGYTADLMGQWGGPVKTTMGANESGGGFMDNMLGKDGWGNLALSGVSAGLQGFMGMKQLGLAKDQLDFQKQSFNKNYGAQKQTTNTQMRDRQKRRYTENPDQYVSPDEYMKQNGIK